MPLFFISLSYIRRKSAKISCFRLLLFLRDQRGCRKDDSFSLSPYIDIYAVYMYFKSSSFTLATLSFCLCSARKMFPKRKLDESTSVSDGQKEQAGPEGQQNKRARVESSPGSGGAPSLPVSAEILPRHYRKQTLGVIGG